MRKAADPILSLWLIRHRERQEQTLWRDRLEKLRQASLARIQDIREKAAANLQKARSKRWDKED